MDSPSSSLSDLLARPAWKWAAPIVSIAVLIAAMVLLHREFAGYHLKQVFAAVDALPLRTLWLSAGTAAASYVVLCGYDFLALHHVGQRISVGRTMLTSFMAFSIGHNVGLAALSGGAIRLRLYGAAGISATQVAVMSGFGVLTTLLGSVLLIGLTLLMRPAQAAVLLHMGTTQMLFIGWLLLLALLVYLIWVSRRRQPLTLRNWSLALPSLTVTLGQIAVAAIDLCLAAACLYVLLPVHSGITFQAFVPVYVLSVVAIMVSNVPGGLGVLESVMLLALPQVPTHELLASLLAYRVIYYVGPLALAGVFLAAHEIWLQRQRVRMVAGMARDWLSAVAPLALSGLVLLTGGVLLLSGATPGIGARLRELSDILPLPLLELSHLLGSVAGLGLIVLARALMRRVYLAWQIALGLLLAGSVFSLLKGFDYEEALILLIVAALLYFSREAFYRRAALLEANLNLRWLFNVAIIVGIVIWIGMLAHRHVDYSRELWWTFAFDSDAPRMLRAALAVGLITAAFILHAWLSPHRRAIIDNTPAEVAAVQAIVNDAPRAAASLALLGDKQFLLHPQHDAFLMYQVSGRSWITMSDPMLRATLTAGVDDQRASELAWSFRELCDEHDGWPVFYQVTPEFLPLYVDMGLALLKLGEEARVPLPSFSLEGSHRAEFRTVRRRAEREGASFEVLPAPLSHELIEQLSAVSTDWLASKSAHEKRFSVGCFAPAYIAQFPVAVVRRQGAIVAFANLWSTARHEELSVDLMRYSHAAPPGVMDYLFVETMLWGKAQGYQWFNLGMAPLSGLEQHYLAPTWHRIGGFVFDVGGHFYNFEGLRRYKQKFLPIWEPRYLAAPGGLALPRVLLDVASLVAGGLKEIVSK